MSLWDHGEPDFSNPILNNSFVLNKIKEFFYHDWNLRFRHWTVTRSPVVVSPLMNPDGPTNDHCRRTASRQCACTRKPGPLTCAADVLTHQAHAVRRRGRFVMLASAHHIAVVLPISRHRPQRSGNAVSVFVTVQSYRWPAFRPETSACHIQHRHTRLRRVVRTQRRYGPDRNTAATTRHSDGVRVMQRDDDQFCSRLPAVLDMRGQLCRSTMHRPSCTRQQ